MIPDPAAFAAEWAAGWNSHDLDRVLAHYAPDVVFRSPVAVRLVDAPDGALRGIATLRAYWTKALTLLPDLHFEVLEVYSGTDTLVVRYRNERGGLVCEVLTFGADGLVAQGRGTYETELLP
jgi:ketosteroid isomerase-like protein